jgi:hypothetical protein
VDQCTQPIQGFGQPVLDRRAAMNQFREPEQFLQ